MQAKNTIKKLFIISLLLIITWLFTSCDYKEEDTKTKEITTNSEKETESGNFKKIKEGEEIITVESSIWTWTIENTNISPNWGGSAKGWTETWKNPLNL